MILDPRERLIVALDVSSFSEAQAMVANLGDSVVFYKIGYQLGFAVGHGMGSGIELAKLLVGEGKQVFLDFNLHDVGEEVAKGVENVARLGATFLTVHAYPQTMHAAVEARAGSSLRILAVPVLTSYADADLAAAGYDFTVSELVAERAAQARDIGIDGIVCSVEEVRTLRPIVGANMILVALGTTPAGTESGDRPFTATPAAAIAAGADYVVLGGALTDAANPKAVAEAVVAEIGEATGSLRE